MATEISTVGHTISTNIFSARAVLESAVASVRSGEQPDTRAVLAAITLALHGIARADALKPSEARRVARESLSLSETLRELIEASPSDAALVHAYETFSEEAESLALGTDPEILQSLEGLRQDIRAGRADSLADWRSVLSGLPG